MLPDPSVTDAESVTPRLPAGVELDFEVIGMPWEEFLAFMKKEWHPGQHMALIGQTGANKTTFAAPLLEQRHYVLAFDPKGGDSTLATLRWPRLLRWPMTKKQLDQIAEGYPARYIVGPKISRFEERPKQIELFRKVLQETFDMGGWTEYVDEFQIAADRKMMNLAKEVETGLIAARDKKISVVTAYQAPSWVPTAAHRQASYLVLWPTRSADVVKKFGEVVGRDWRQLFQLMRNMPKWHCLVATPDPFAPLIITSAPKRR